MWGNSGGDGVAMQGQLGKAYTEQAFRHLLEVERARAGRSERELRLVLVTVRNGQPGTVERLRPSVASRIFEGLWLTVREMDLVGWFRDGRVAGAVLAERAAGDAATSAAIQRRVGEVLVQKLPPQVASRLRVRIVNVAPRSTRSRADV
jgi:hypothetical protein